MSDSPSNPTAAGPNVMPNLVTVSTDKTITGPLLAEDNKWQWMLLPYMSAFIVFAALAFLVVTFFQLNGLTSQIKATPPLDIPEYSNGTPLDAYFTSVLLNLEAHTLARRYHQINAGLMTRTWIEYLGFFTGMLLAFIGSIFILGKLQVEVSSANFKGGILSANLKSSSPGLIMAFLGIILILATIIINPKIEFTDGGAYLSRYTPSFTQTTSLPSEPEGNACFTQEDSQEFSRLVLQTNDLTPQQQTRRDELRTKKATCETEITP